MKKYVSCFLFFFLLTSASLITLFLMTVGEEAQRAEEVQMQESVEEPVFAKETKEEIHVVLNMEQVENQTVAEDEERYFLVAEEGYLIVYDKGQETTDLFTHMPLAEFPAEEQERLMTGIWFPTMAEIFSYLESYSSSNFARKVNLRCLLPEMGKMRDSYYLKFLRQVDILV